MEHFTEVVDGIYLLKTPFSSIWSGCVLVKGEEPCLIDSGANDDIVVNVILPALRTEGLALSDISWLLHTHSHGDHIGGHAKIKELQPQIRIATIEQGQEALNKPAAVAKRIRSQYPKNSPKPQLYLRGVEADRILKDGERLTDRLSVIYTPGHDSDCVAWVDDKTHAVICGDSLQGNGTVTQGIAFYQYLRDYQASLAKIRALKPQDLLMGHDYDVLGYLVQGADKAAGALDACMEITMGYQSLVDKMIEQGITDTATIATSLVNEKGCGTPAALFLAMYSADEHILSGKPLQLTAAKA